MRLLEKLLPENFRKTLYLRYFGLTKIPLLLYARPAVVEQSDNHTVIRIPLRRRNRNHQGSMYFPILAVGADCAVGMLAVTSIITHGEKISFIFRDFHADFYRRATDDVLFTCDQGAEIDKLVTQAINSGERVEKTFQVVAIVPAESDEPVAKFSLTLSLKRA